MKASKLISAAITQIQGQPSPWRDGLAHELIEIHRTILLHEDYRRLAQTDHDASNTSHVTSQTSLGHSPTGSVVDATQTHTDAALEMLDCND